MGLIVKKKTGASGWLGLWQIDGIDNEQLLSGPSKGAVSPARQPLLLPLQRDAVKLALQSLSGQKEAELEYDSFGKPFLKNSTLQVSVSHSYDKVAVITEENGPTGIDIELIRPKIERIAPKFMSDEEMRSLPHTARTEMLFIYWCAKEALYKLYGKKELHFRKHLLIEPFHYTRRGKIKGIIQVPQMKKKFDLCYEKTGEHMLVYVTYT